MRNSTTEHVIFSPSNLGLSRLAIAGTIADGLPAVEACQLYNVNETDFKAPSFIPMLHSSDAKRCRATRTEEDILLEYAPFVA